MNHHNACDSWILRTPTVTLAITFPEVTPCEGVLAGAPSPAPVEDGRIRYRITHQDGSINEGWVLELDSETRD